MALDGGEWLALCPSCFASRDRTLGTHWIGGWVDPEPVSMQWHFPYLNCIRSFHCSFFYQGETLPGNIMIYETMK